MSKFRTFSRRLFIIGNIIAVIFFLLACANVFLHPGKWWFLALLGLVFPFLFAFVFIFFVAALFLPSCRLWSFLSLAALLVGWPNIHSFLAFHPGNSFHQEKAPNALRVMTWNIRSFDEYASKKKDVTGHRPRMMEFIDSQHADVLCLEEFYENRNPKDLYSNIDYIRNKLHFPYYFFSRDYIHDPQSESGVAIFSKYPIIDSAMLRYPHPDGIKATESLISADVSVGDDTVRVFATHLQSVLFRSKDFHDIEIIKNVDDSIVTASRSIAKKLRAAFRHRGDQAEAVRAQMDKSPYPSVICGDFNDVPNSYTYFTIRGDWQDAWLKKGFGIGRTYVFISPTLRIDYILADPQLQVLQCRKFAPPYSDHHPVVADLQLP